MLPDRLVYENNLQSRLIYKKSRQSTNFIKKENYYVRENYRVIGRSVED